MKSNLFFRVLAGASLTTSWLICGLAIGQQPVQRRVGNTNGGVMVLDQVQVRDHRKPTGSVPPPFVRPPVGGSPSGYAGPFSGASRIEVQQPDPIGVGAGQGANWKNVGDLNLPSTLDTAWLVIRGMIKNELTFFFEKQPRDHRNRETLESIAGRNLYDLSITMADSSRATTLISVPNDGRSVTLLYRVPGNKMKFKAEVDNFFDPTISIETTITIGITLQPSGDAQQPLKVSNAYVEFSNTEASVDGNIIHDVVKKFVEFVKGTDFDRKIEGIVNGRRKDISDEANRGISIINRRLSPHSTSGASVVKFAWDRSRSELVVRMSRPEMVLIGN